MENRVYPKSKAGVPMVPELVAHWCQIKDYHQTHKKCLLKLTLTIKLHTRCALMVSNFPGLVDNDDLA